MGQVWTRDKWNYIIQQVNDRIEECQSGDPLPEVPEGHIWSVEDIVAVRDKLTEICRNGPQFSAALVKWKQDIIDELNAAIDECDCGCTETQVEYMRSIHGLSSYVPCSWGNIRWEKNEWYDEGDEHWHFQWTYQADYDYSAAVGGSYGSAGMKNVGHTCKFRIEWWSWPWEGPMEYLSDESVLGSVQTNCDGIVTSAPVGTYVKIFPQDYRVAMQPIGGTGPYTIWDTAGAACC
jgi:hypothetical protein